MGVGLSVLQSSALPPTQQPAATTFRLPHSEPVFYDVQSDFAGDQDDPGMGEEDGGGEGYATEADLLEESAQDIRASQWHRQHHQRLQEDEDEEGGRRLRPNRWGRSGIARELARDEELLGGADPTLDAVRHSMKHIPLCVL